MTVIVTHPACCGHDPGFGHPESPARLDSVLRAIEDIPLDRHEAPLATEEQVLCAHTPALIETIRFGHGALDPDTILSEGSYEAALRAAGAACLATGMVMAGKAENAFCAVRPPGHHAERNRAMGFCLFNNVAIAALHARAAHNLTRVAVLDFDHHHGNGTQDIAWNDPDFFFASTHKWPDYPGSGRRDEVGAFNNILNFPLSGREGSSGFRKCWETAIFPALAAFQPDFLFVSAGFDGHLADPVGNLGLTTEDFAWIGEKLREQAQKLCSGRLVAALEGGYNLAALADSTRAFVTALAAKP